MSIENAIPLQETWDEVAKTYSIEIEEGEYELAVEIARTLSKHGIMPGAKILELGCGSGHLSAALAMKGYQTALLDFSPISLEKAKETYNRYGIQGEFICADLMHMDDICLEQYDLLWNSGVMEHFNDTAIMEVFRSIRRLNSDNLLILVPNPESIAYLSMRYVRMSRQDWPYGEEFLRDNFEELILSCGYKNIEKIYLADAITKHCFHVAYQDSKYVDSFDMLLDKGFLPEYERYLVGYFASSRDSINSPAINAPLGSSTENITKFFNLNAELYGLQIEKKQNEELIQKKDVAILELDSTIKEKEGVIKEQEAVLKKREEIIIEQEAVIKEQEAIVEEHQKFKQDIEVMAQKCKDLHELNELLKKEIITLSDENRALDELYHDLEKEKNALLDIIYAASTQCYGMARGKLFKMLHVLYRLKEQFLQGSLRDKKAFLKWLIHRNGVYHDHAYNPLFHIINILENRSSQTIPTAIEVGDSLSDQSNLAYTLLDEEYSKYDVILLSIIDYDFRFQRPQHFAELYAANGHRVFYINANFHSVNNDTITMINKNLYNISFSNGKHTQIHHMDWRNQEEELFAKLDSMIQANFIRDAVVMVEYPNWIIGAEYLRDRYGFKIITDYLDDFTGFINPNERKIKDNCIKLLGLSDQVIASSQFLYDIAVQYNNKTRIVRNGTEYEHFHSIFNYVPRNERKVVGYYGAVAEWFDSEKVCYAAEMLPDCDFVIIGEVTAGKERLAKHNNIKLLGEQPYRVLPDYLKEFDVCLIPFDTSTDLIKATNPVKFYEYLSAGKKVVATNIPELQPFKDQLVYLADTKEEFLESIKLCLDGNDTLASKEERAEFALNNSWKARFNEIYDYIKNAVPMVSIIVLTYNNLAYNKLCIDSILKKTAYPNYELIIVDNNSMDGTQDYLSELKMQEAEAVRIYLNEDNLGFAGGNNMGIRNSSGEYVLLLNNDTIVTRGWITSLVKHFEQDDTLGMIGPVTNSIGNEAKISAKYCSIKEMNHFAYNYTMKHWGERYENPKSLAMFCTIISKNVIESCGVLDENYKVGMFEDDDYAEAVKKGGYRLAIAEDSFVHHFDGGSFKSLDDEKYRTIFENNRKFFETKWNMKWKPHKYRDGVDASYDGRIAVDK